MTGIKFSPRSLRDLSTKFKQRLIFACLSIDIFIHINVVCFVGSLSASYFALPEKLIPLLNTRNVKAIADILHGGITVKPNFLISKGFIHDASKDVEAATLSVSQNVPLHIIQDLTVHRLVIH